jgi:ABC-2 type transport system permease protein
MRGVGAIYRRELAALFLAPLGWGLLALALLVNGAFFLVYLKSADGDVDAAFRYAFGLSAVYWALLASLPPLITMRMISEEARSGILEYLLTAPVSDAAVATGKFLAAASFMALLWSSALVYALALAALGTPPDWGAVLGGYAGALCASALFCALGLLASALSPAPALAAFLAFAAGVAWLLLPWLATLSESALARRAVAAVDLVARYQRSFLIGVLDSAQVVFFLGASAVLVFLSARALETRRWR